MIRFAGDAGFYLYEQQRGKGRGSEWELNWWGQKTNIHRLWIPNMTNGNDHHLKTRKMNIAGVCERVCVLRDYDDDICNQI